MRFLLDTKVCLDFLLARSGVVRGRIERAFGSLAVSAISAAELHVGNRLSVDPVGDARRVDLFLAMVEVPDFDAAAASAYGVMVRSAGIRRASLDRLIAAHALALDVTLVTGNEADFADIPGLRIETWR